MQKVRFAYNPKAGETVITDWLDNIIDIYQRGGYSIMPYRLAFTEAEETDLLDDIDGSYHHILVAGGDGTVNYVVNMLKRRNLDLPVAVLPTGTANDFANTLGVPSDIEKACRRILGGEIRRVDLGRANDEYFVNVFSCGLFTDVSQKTPTILKNTFGKLAYYFGGLGELPNFRKMHISIESDGGNYEGPSLIFFVFNGRTAGQMRFAYLSEIDDGLLDVIVIKGDRPIETVRTIFHFIKRNTKDYPAGIVHFKSRDILLHSYNEETTDIDGQPGPRFPVRIACEPGALRVICPQKKPKKLRLRYRPRTLYDRLCLEDRRAPGRQAKPRILPTPTHRAQCSGNIRSLPKEKRHLRGSVADFFRIQRPHGKSKESSGHWRGTNNGLNIPPKRVGRNKRRCRTTADRPHRESSRCGG